jgi:hypothetical protein
MFLSVSPIANHDLTELFVTRQEVIERFKFAQCARLERSTHMLVDKWLEPIP